MERPNRGRLASLTMTWLAPVASSAVQLLAQRQSPECGNLEENGALWYSRGRPRAALISIEDLELLERMEEEREALMLAQAVSTETRFYSIAEVEAELARLETESLARP